MDIESRLYRVRSCGFGGYSVAYKITGETCLAEKMNAHQLAMMKECQFDAFCAEFFNGSH